MPFAPPHDRAPRTECEQIVSKGPPTSSDQIESDQKYDRDNEDRCRDEPCLAVASLLQGRARTSRVASRDHSMRYGMIGGVLTRWGLGGLAISSAAHLCQGSSVRIGASVDEKRYTPKVSPVVLTSWPEVRNLSRVVCPVSLNTKPA